MDMESNSQEGSTQTTGNALGNNSLALNSQEGPQPKSEHYQKHPKEKSNVKKFVTIQVLVPMAPPRI